jgi:hypothetical protein
VIASATIEPKLFLDYFSLPETAVIRIPGRTL